MLAQARFQFRLRPRHTLAASNATHARSHARKLKAPQTASVTNIAKDIRSLIQSQERISFILSGSGGGALNCKYGRGTAGGIRERSEPSPHRSAATLSGTTLLSFAAATLACARMAACLRSNARV